MTTVALAQIVSTDDPKENLSLVAAATARAAGAGARLVVFPEATMCRFGVPLAPVAEELDGPWATAVRGIADAAGLTVVAGMFTPGEEGTVRNTVLVTGGGAEAAYHKIHLYDAFGFRESDTVTAGTTPVTVRLDDSVLGVATCYDVRFPALFRELARRGADLVALPASWGAGPGKAEQWELLVRARALDAGVFVAACDQGDPATAGQTHTDTPTGVGGSLIAAPTGVVLGALGGEPDLLVLDLDLAAAQEARARTGVLVNARRFHMSEREPGSAR